MKEFSPEIELTEEQEAEAARIEDVLNAKSRATNRHVARLMASKSNQELLGATEFQVRDAVHRLGAAGIDAALAERKKGGTKDPASFAHAAARMPASSDTPPAK